jgi:uncharacterized membrane protein YfcA
LRRQLRRKGRFYAVAFAFTIAAVWVVVAGVSEEVVARAVGISLLAVLLVLLFPLPRPGRRRRRVRTTARAYPSRRRAA